MSEFEVDNTNDLKKGSPEDVNVKAEVKPETATTLKHELDGFEDLNKKDATSGDTLPAYLREIEAGYASPKVNKAIADLVSNAYSEFNTKAYNRFWPDFLKEADELEPAPFNKDSELPVELEQYFDLQKGNLNLEFESAKMQIITQTETRFTRSIGNILAKNEVYQRLKYAYTASMDAESDISPETLYEYQKENRKAVEDFAKAKADYLEAVSEQYDRDHLSELTDDLDRNSRALVNGVIKAVENKVAPTKLALQNAISPEISKSTIPLKNKMVERFDELEQINDEATAKAIEDFKRRVRREMRRARQQDVQIHVDELQGTSKALQAFTADTNESPMSHVDEAVLPEEFTIENNETPIVEETTPVAKTEPIVEEPKDPELDAVLNGPAIPVNKEPVAPVAEKVSEEPKVDEVSNDFDPFAATGSFDDIFGATPKTEQPAVEQSAVEEPAAKTPEIAEDTFAVSEPVEKPEEPKTDFGFDPFAETEPAPTPVTKTDTEFDPFSFDAPANEPAVDPVAFDPFATTNEELPESSTSKDQFDANNIFGETGLGDTPKVEEPAKEETPSSTFDASSIFDNLV